MVVSCAQAKKMSGNFVCYIAATIGIKVSVSRVAVTVLHTMLADHRKRWSEMSLVTNTQGGTHVLLPLGI